MSLVANFLFAFGVIGGFALIGLVIGYGVHALFRWFWGLVCDMGDMAAGAEPVREARLRPPVESPPWLIRSVDPDHKWTVEDEARLRRFLDEGGFK